jgi:hypothetical protein
MGETTVTIGRLKLKLDLRQLLDGYEPIDVRQKGSYNDTFFVVPSYEDLVESQIDIDISS